mmetsp:Transcript_12876/g.30227  ORF Transcript_12876/g.30227 Transcript_12876/m.30227 type:complete len:246 (-) Transcript_12876:1026-1763(-)
MGQSQRQRTEAREDTKKKITYPAGGREQPKENARSKKNTKNTHTHTHNLETKRMPHVACTPQGPLKRTTKRALQAAEDNPAGARGAHHQQTERRGQAHDQTHLHVEDRRDEEGDDPKREVSARAAPQQLSSGEVDERLQCREDDGCQHGEGQRAEEGREPQQHKHDHSRLYNAVHRCATPERGDQCRAREGAGDGKSVEQPAEKVGEAERNELLVALNRVSVLNAEDTGHRHGDEKAGEGDDRRA